MSTYSPSGYPALVQAADAKAVAIYAPWSGSTPSSVAPPDVNTCYSWLFPLTVNKGWPIQVPEDVNRSDLDASGEAVAKLPCITRNAQAAINYAKAFPGGVLQSRTITCPDGRQVQSAAGGGIDQAVLDCVACGGRSNDDRSCTYASSDDSGTAIRTVAIVGAIAVGLYLFFGRGK